MNKKFCNIEQMMNLMLFEVSGILTTKIFNLMQYDDRKREFSNALPKLLLYNLVSVRVKGLV